MRVCFVYPDVEGAHRYGAKKFYHGIGYLSSVLKEKGHHTSLVYAQQEPTKERFLAEVLGNHADLVGFSSTTNQFSYVRAWASWLKEAAPEIHTICGGVHPTLVPETVIAEPGIDTVCVGEGEYPLLELAESLQAGQRPVQIANLWLKRDGTIIRNPLRPLIQDLDQLPFADRELFGLSDILKANDGWLDIMAGRGCPYDCSYCCNPSLKQTFRGKGKYVRFRTVPNLLAEIDHLSRTYTYHTLNFQDDVFTLDHRWTLEFCRAYRASFDTPFWINARVERILEENVVRALAGAGCKGVRIGVESGNERIREELLSRKISDASITRAFGLFKKHHLQTYTCNMLGLPDENLEMIQQTIALNRRLSPASLQFSVFYPYPMTRLHDLAVAKGYFKPANDGLPSYYGDTSLLSTPSLSAEGLAKGYQAFVELQRELALKQHSLLRYALYTVLRLLYRNDTVLLGKHLRRLGRIMEWAMRICYT
ncbi:MAG: cobalamin B12-binding domain-containing protein [Chloroflexi bacterium]|nr:cobalamin B12-binding domain-containing protein [Chloroflexota bacterium]